MASGVIVERPKWILFAFIHVRLRHPIFLNMWGPTNFEQHFAKIRGSLTVFCLAAVFFALANAVFAEFSILLAQSQVTEFGQREFEEVSLWNLLVGPNPGECAANAKLVMRECYIGEYLFRLYIYCFLFFVVLTGLKKFDVLKSKLWSPYAIAWFAPFSIVPIFLHDYLGNIFETMPLFMLFLFPLVFFPVSYFSFFAFVIYIWKIANGNEMRIGRGTQVAFVVVNLYSLFTLQGLDGI